MCHRPIKIRSSVEGDAESAFGLIQELGYPELEAENFRRIFAEILSNPYSLIVLAEDSNGRAVGLMTISHRPQLRLNGEIVSVDELVVAEDARGLGVGQALLKHAKNFAQGLGAQRLELHTKRNRESYRRQFYVKNGFREANSAVMRIDKDFQND